MSQTQLPEFVSIDIGKLENERSEFVASHPNVPAQVASFAFDVRFTLNELHAIAEDLEEIGDHFGERVARYQSSGIYGKAARVYDAHTSLSCSVQELLRSFESISGDGDE